MKVLVIEDEKGMLENIVHSLQQELYVVETATDYHSAFEKISVYDYDCIILDIGLPGGDGLSLLTELKQDKQNTAVIIVSAKDSVDDKIAGLNLGADDYLPKPFHMAELHARIKSVLRRHTLDGSNIISINNLEIDIDQRSAIINGAPLLLNRKEFDVLLYLCNNRNRLVNKAALAEHVWGDYIDGANSFDFVYSQIKNLRKKLKANEANVEIQAIYGVGYKLVVE